jgi:hypothetical protein
MVVLSAPKNRKMISERFVRRYLRLSSYFASELNTQNRQPESSAAAGSVNRPAQCKLRVTNRGKIAHAAEPTTYH